RVETEAPYVLFLITALFPWQWFANSVNAANFFFLANSSLIKKVRFPREFLVFAGVLNDLVHFVISIPVIVVFLLWFGYRPSVHWVWQVPVLVAVQFFITQGLALIVATSNLFFRDLERLTGIFMLLWFYLTPVIYPRGLLVEKGCTWMLYANPMASLIVCWREVFLNGTLPPLMLGAAAGFGLVTFLVGRALYRSLEWRFAEIV
ncbi:MAG TPA: ABC transporter permease, partial [Planctomycetota bacterium]|nr:ABC transporter permease [Planctomycetota bacterium]